jgi:NitT/TauT family transport system substrate-binding protein
MQRSRRSGFRSASRTCYAARLHASFRPAAHSLSGSFGLSVGILANCRRALILAAAFVGMCGTASAEAIKIGIIKTNNTAMIVLAQDRGYFKAEGLDAEFVYFDASQPIAVAVASGDIDFGLTALTAGFFKLASQGVLRIIAGHVHEVPGFQGQGWFVSDRAYQSGIRALKDMPGHNVALTQIGASSHYSLGLVGEKYGFDLKSVQILPLQSIPNMVTALTGGRADFGAMSLIPALKTSIEHGDIRVVAWVGDDTPWQFGAVFTATKTADERHETVDRFLRAYRKGARDFHDAFADESGKPTENATTAAVLEAMAHDTGQTVEQAKFGISYIDRDARLDVKDVLHQIAWYRSQGLLKGDFDPNSIIDMRYVKPLP